MLAGATVFVTDQVDDVVVIAALLGVPIQLLNAASGGLVTFEGDPSTLLLGVLAGSYENPFTGELMTTRQAVELSGFWRRLIDKNRTIAGGLGFAFWKRAHIAPLLWGGAGDFAFLTDLQEVGTAASLAIWRTKAPADQLAEISRAAVPLIEVEDGFLRSDGLGADCVPPLSITVDALGGHFDPAQPSELELLLETEQFDATTIERARRLRRAIVEAKLGKYHRGDGAEIDRRAGSRKHILVPGQVEDDRAVKTGGCGLTSNLELLARVRAQAPDAYIVYKPHPDVLAGHRRGALVSQLCLQHADEIVADLSIVSLIDMVDEVHVNTSLAGFEALLRGKTVTTYGVPFYAGWGLTQDLGPVPDRRTARRSIDELVAATLLIYPRYLDPVTGLPCPAEIVVDRLSSGTTGNPSLIVLIRKLQGRLMRRLRSVVQ
ncbi:hypothetical protein GCM10022276_13960 [Sphingomonas limnosediminicola]|uniref:Capsular polysaccharide export protein n=2 Tax=Sphingomonas limnosediminicola TaxID=940133 RepID=A0ABP7LC52_9SPHN